MSCFSPSKFYQVKWFFIMIVVMSHLIFSVVFSIYTGLLFGLLCAPDDNSSLNKRWDWLDDIQCKMSDNQHTVNLAFAAWMFLILFDVFTHFVKSSRLLLTRRPTS
eukprot:TRINITY_DN25825_c0_g1_i1.p1 TRINITY_DN25825_c0_g1~~TRINITY_DN25825_c0_g1_i1.p1  ORF type:complete len:106 (-),score=11.35 TRINITY_DN25825_c0_g1_i1:206-523(-)